MGGLLMIGNGLPLGGKLPVQLRGLPVDVGGCGHRLEGEEQAEALEGGQQVSGLAAIQASTQVAVAESIIVGQVPDSFVDVNNDSDMLNLIP